MKNIDENPLNMAPTVPRASESGAQEGRETPKMRKERMLADLRAGKGTDNKSKSRKRKVPEVIPHDGIPPEVLELEKRNGIAPADKPGIGEAERQEVIDVLRNGRPVRDESYVKDGKPVGDPPSRKRRVVAKGVYPPRPKYMAAVSIDGVGTFRTPVYHILDAGFGVIAIMPCGVEDTIFIPEAGAKVSISADLPTGHVEYKCFYPGVLAKWTEGADSVNVLAFIKADVPVQATPET